MWALSGFLPMLLVLCWTMCLSLTNRFDRGTTEALVVRMIPMSKQRPSFRAPRVHLARPSFSISSTRTNQSDGDGNDNGSSAMDDWNKGGTVAVEVRRTVSFPPGSFEAAANRNSDSNDPLGEATERLRDAWMEYHWRKGGGLPIVIIEKEQEGSSSSNISENSNALGKKRVIAPVLMEETISSFPSNVESQPDASGGSKASLELEYKVTSPGPFFGPDLVDGSHTGRVTFSSSYAPSSENSDDKNLKAITTTLVWKVEFDAIRLVNLYQKVTEFTIGTAATTVQEAVATPRLLTLRTRLSLPMTRNSGGEADPAHRARQEWLDFQYSSTFGGLPLLPPIAFGEILPEGGGIARKKLFIPPYLLETAMVEGPSTTRSGASDADGTATACYRLENPGWFTLPFLVHTHLGRVTFRSVLPVPEEDKESTESLVDMTWEIEMRPFAFAAPLVEQLTESTISTIARNLRVKLEAPGDVVTIFPPRGGSGQPLGSVPKASWVGRVLDAHLRDKRSSWEQSISLLQPWTWADSGTGRRGEDEVEFEWSDGSIE